jgi:hypothetical protein
MTCWLRWLSESSLTVPEAFLTLSELERNGILAKHSAESGKSMRVLEKDVTGSGTPHKARSDLAVCFLITEPAPLGKAFFDLQRFHCDGHDSLIPILRS